MNSEELVNLKDGKYQLTDGIYDYTLTVGRNQDKTKFYAIYEKGSSANILITQRIEKDEDGKKYKYLSAMAGVGGLYIHSDDIYLILSKLKFVESGSEMSLVNYLRELEEPEKANVSPYGCSLFRGELDFANILKGGDLVDENSDIDICSLFRGELDFANILNSCNSPESINLKKGWFLHCVHDLIGGLTIYGVFETELKATDFSKNISGYDEKNILFLYYVEFDGKIFALGQMSECIGVDYRND